MWYSIHFYEIRFQTFREIVLYVMKNNNIGKFKFFFTRYIDAKGSHFRFRFKVNSKIEANYILELCNIKFDNHLLYFSIYDPEYNKYGDFLDFYENESVIQCNKIILNDVSVENLGKNIKLFIDDYIEYLVTKLHVGYIINDVVEYALQKWSSVDKNNVISSSLSNNNIIINNFGEYDDMAPSKLLKLDKNSQIKLIFNLIHMYFNRVGVIPGAEFHFYSQVEVDNE